MSQGYHQPNINLAAEATWNAADFGANPSLADNTSAIQATINRAVAAGGGRVYIPAGTYACLSRLVLSSGVSIVGDGKGRTVLDFTGATIVDACIYGEGNIVALPTLAVGASRGDTSITLASAPTIAAGEVIIIWSSVNGDFNPARNIYHKGEMGVVASVAGAVVTLDAPLRDDYAVAGTLNVYRLDPVQNITVENLTVECVRGVTVNGIQIYKGRRISIREVEANGSREANISLDIVYDSEVISPTIRDNQAAVSLNYGVRFGNSQNGTVRGGVIETTRHCVTTGGDSYNGSVVNRDIRVSGVHGVATGETALDWHGNTEDCWYEDCSADGGISWAGNRNRVRGCTFRSRRSDGAAILFWELNGFDHVAEDCDCIATVDMAGAEALVIWDRSAPENIVVGNGKLALVNVRMQMGAFTGKVLSFVTRATLDTLDVDLIDCTVDRAVVIGAGEQQVEFSGSAGAAFRTIRAVGGSIRGCGLRYILGAAQTIIVDGMDIEESAWWGVRVGAQVPASFPWSRQDIHILNTKITEADRAGIRIDGSSIATDANVYIENNISVRNAQDRGAAGHGTIDLASISVQNANVFKVHENVVGDDQAVPTQARTIYWDTIATIDEKNQTVIGSVTSETRLSITAGRSVVERTAVPAAGNWTRGSEWINTAPSAGGVPGGMCVTSGTPGTWKDRAALAV